MTQVVMFSIIIKKWVVVGTFLLKFESSAVSEKYLNRELIISLFEHSEILKIISGPDIVLKHFLLGKIRNRLKLFWNYFWKNPPPVMKLQVLTSRLIPKFSKKSNENLLFELCKVFEFSKMHFWPWKRPKPELLSS